MAEEIERTLGRILASQEATEQRLTRIETKVDDIVRLDVEHRAHASFDDERFLNHGTDITRAHAKIHELHDKIDKIDPPSKRKQVAAVTGAGGAGAVIVWVLEKVTGGGG